MNSPMQNTIILLVEQIVSALGTEFKIYLPQVVPQILKVFMHDTSQGRMVTAKVNEVIPFDLPPQEIDLSIVRFSC